MRAYVCVISLVLFQVWLPVAYSNCTPGTSEKKPVTENGKKICRTCICTASMTWVCHTERFTNECNHGIPTSKFCTENKLQAKKRDNSACFSCSCNSEGILACVENGLPQCENGDKNSQILSALEYFSPTVLKSVQKKPYSFIDSNY